VESNLLLSQALARLTAPGALAGRRLAGVWVFGSHARATATASSDLDLGLLSEPPLELARFRLMDELARALGCEVDVIDLATASPLLVWEVLTTGRAILEVDPLAVESFVRRARFAAEDAEQRDRMILLGQLTDPSPP
jgi:predicted nucleotidyltransferase